MTTLQWCNIILPPVTTLLIVAWIFLQQRINRNQRELNQITYERLNTQGELIRRLLGEPTEKATEKSETQLNGKAHHA